MRSGRASALVGVCAAIVIAGSLAVSGPASAASASPSATPTATSSVAPRAATVKKLDAATSSSYNGLALTPPMGWNDWSYYQCNINESLILAQAKALVSSGLAAKGYNTVTIDDCWLAKSRDANGNLVADPTTFPDGMKYVGDQLHAMGLKFGIYEDAGTTTCGGYPGSFGHYQQDADTFASWGVDYVKLDGCNVPTNSGETNAQSYIQDYQQFSQALVNSGRPMVFSDSSPAYFQGSSAWDSVISAASKDSNLWREGADTALGQATGPQKWSAITYNYSYNEPLGQYAGPGHWNDPDFLLTGDSGLTTTEMQSQMSLWAEMAAPLISSTDLTSLSSAELAILGNQRIIAVDQDSLGAQGSVVASGDNDNVLAKPLANGDVSVVLFNEGTSPQTIRTSASAIGLSGNGPFTLTDLVSGQQTVTTGAIGADVPAHGTVMYRVHPGVSGSLPPSVSLSLAPAVGRSGVTNAVGVVLTNNGPTAVDTAQVSLTGPSGWAITGSPATVSGIAPGGSATVSFPVSIASPQPGAYEVTATATYRSSGAQVTVTDSSDIDEPYPNLAAAFNNVGITDGSTYALGNFDGDGNSFSAEQLASVGVTPGSTVTAAGVRFAWPSAPAGTNDNVQAGGQVISMSGAGGALAFLGSEAGNVQGTVTVTYTDGTTSTGQLGFPNWSFYPVTEFGSQLAIATNGRETPSGYFDSQYQYQVFYNSIPLTAGKEIATVTLPSNGDIHIFAIATTPSAPVITSGAPSAAQVGVPYSFTVTAVGNPASTFAVGKGSLPDGLSLNATTGVISGTPTAAGTSSFTVIAGNGVAPDATQAETLTVAAASATSTPTPGSATSSSGTAGSGTPASGAAAADASATQGLASTGSNVLPGLAGALLVLLAGGVLLYVRRRATQR